MWVGDFKQNGKAYDMTFDPLYIGDLPEVYGLGEDAYGAFTLSGSRDGQNVTFNKHYNSLDKVMQVMKRVVDDYYITYTGTLDENDVLTGDWQIYMNDEANSAHGQFELHKQ